MILHLGNDVAVHAEDIVAIIDLTQGVDASTDAMLTLIRRRKRLLSQKGIDAKSAVICADARRAAGVSENPRVYLSPISSVTLAQRVQKSVPDLREEAL